MLKVTRLAARQGRRVANTCALNARMGSTYTAPLREMDFVINEVQDFPSHWKALKHQNGEQVDSGLSGMILETMGRRSSPKRNLLLFL